MKVVMSQFVKLFIIVVVSGQPFPFPEPTVSTYDTNNPLWNGQFENIAENCGDTLPLFRFSKSHPLQHPGCKRGNKAVGNCPFAVTTLRPCIKWFYDQFKDELGFNFVIVSVNPWVIMGGYVYDCPMPVTVIDNGGTHSWLPCVAAITKAPVTTAPTAAPVTAAPVTAAPVTAAPVTAAPATAAPVTAAPVTAAPVTAAPVTQFIATPGVTTTVRVSNAGDNVIHVRSISGFSVATRGKIGTGNTYDNFIVKNIGRRTSSRLFLQKPMQYPHAIGEPVVAFTQSPVPAPSLVKTNDIGWQTIMFAILTIVLVISFMLESFARQKL